jgi:dienelactone hydrolase
MASKKAKVAKLVPVPADGATLQGDLFVPDEPTGAVLFAHDSGSDRHSPVLQRIASVFNDGGLATLVLDLVSASEQAEWGMYRDNYALHADRLVRASEFLAARAETRSLRLGLFGAGRGLVGALLAAERLRTVRAVVGADGRPDLAGPNLFLIKAPTLLLVKGTDTPLIVANERALTQLRVADHRVGIVSGANDLFLDPNAREELALRARAWFAHYLAASPSTEPPIEVWHAPR